MFRSVAIILTFVNLFVIGSCEKTFGSYDPFKGTFVQSFKLKNPLTCSIYVVSSDFLLVEGCLIKELSVEGTKFFLDDKVITKMQDILVYPVLYKRGVLLEVDEQNLKSGSKLKFTRETDVEQQEELILPEWFIVPFIGKTPFENSSRVENSSFATASDILLINSQTIILDNFSFFGVENSSYFFYGSKRQNQNAKIKDRYQITYPNGSKAHLRIYKNETVILNLPKNITFKDVDQLEIICPETCSKSEKILTKVLLTEEKYTPPPFYFDLNKLEKYPGLCQPIYTFSSRSNFQPVPPCSRTSLATSVRDSFNWLLFLVSVFSTIIMKVYHI